MYDPIFLTGNEQEERELGHRLAALFEYLLLDEEDAAPVYVQRVGNVIEIRPVQGSLESLTIMSS